MALAANVGGIELWHALVLRAFVIEECPSYQTHSVLHLNLNFSGT